MYKHTNRGIFLMETLHNLPIPYLPLVTQNFFTCYVFHMSKIPNGLYNLFFFKPRNIYLSQCSPKIEKIAKPFLDKASS